jgi:DnaJ like chaperone protein
MEYHPDTLVSKGLGEEFLKAATDKFRAIQEAYDQIKRDRGL